MVRRRFDAQRYRGHRQRKKKKGPTRRALDPRIVDTTLFVTYQSACGEREATVQDLLTDLSKQPTKVTATCKIHLGCITAKLRVHGHLGHRVFQRQRLTLLTVATVHTPQQDLISCRSMNQA